MPAIKRICIIDDDPIFVFGIKRFLSMENFGAEYFHFSNGKEAIEGLSDIANDEEERPDLILVDLNMPVMDGWQFLKAFSSLREKWTPHVFIVSSSIDPVDLERAKDFPFVEEFVVKPVSSTRIKELVQNYQS